MKAPKLFNGLEQYSDRLLREGKPQHIANSVWACATLGVKAPKLFNGLDQCSDRLLREGKPQNIANSVWACSTLGVKAPKLFDGLDQHSDRLLREGNPQAIANSVWACATLGVKAPKLFNGLEQYSDRMLREGTPQAIANSVWACAVLNYGPSHGFVRNMATSVAKSDDTCSLIMCCWSLFVLAIVADDAESSRELLVVWSRVTSLLSIPEKLQDLTALDIEQILMVEAVGKLYGVPLEPLMESVASEICTKVGTDGANRSSKLHKKISRSLSKLGYDHELELPPFPSLPGIMAIDIASQERQVAIEVDGPSHFLCSPKFTLLNEYNGPSLFKRGVLERLGWKVINIDYREANLHGCSPKWLAGLLELNDDLRSDDHEHGNTKRT